MMNCCSEMMSLTRSPIETIRTRLPASSTGRWRSRFSVTHAMHSALVWLGCTYITGLTMMSRTGVTFDERAISTILRA